MDKINIMKRLASQIWGEVQSQKKLLEGVYWFTTAGHGGYIVDTDKYPKLKGFEVTVYIRKNSNKYRPNEQHYAVLEEDCDWAVAEYLYPEILKAASEIFEFDYLSRKVLTKSTVRKWNRRYLKEDDKAKFQLIFRGTEQVIAEKQNEKFYQEDIDSYEYKYHRPISQRKVYEDGNVEYLDEYIL